MSTTKPALSPLSCGRIYARHLHTHNGQRTHNQIFTRPLSRPSALTPLLLCPLGGIPAIRPNAPQLLETNPGRQSTPPAYKFDLRSRDNQLRTGERIDRPITNPEWNLSLGRRLGKTSKKQTNMFAYGRCGFQGNTETTRSEVVVKPSSGSWLNPALFIHPNDGSQARAQPDPTARADRLRLFLLAQPLGRWFAQSARAITHRSGPYADHRNWTILSQTILILPDIRGFRFPGLDRISSCRSARQGWLDRRKQRPSASMSIWITTPQRKIWTRQSARGRSRQTLPISSPPSIEDPLTMKVSCVRVKARTTLL